jgi:hypothetical protein
MLIKFRFRFPEVFLGMLLAVAIFAMGGVFWSSQHLSNQSIIEQRQEETWWKRAIDPVAIFTLGLICVGIVQLALFYWQLRLIRTSLAEAKIAADASSAAAEAATRQAKVAEDTLSKLERPWLFVELLQELRGNPDDEFEEPYALFDVVNHGRGPAIIEEFYGEISEAELRPGSSLLRDEFHGIVGPGKAMEACKIHCPLGFAYDLTVNPADGTQFPIPKPTQNGWEVFLRILIHYRDIGGGAHISAFCWRYDHGVNRWVKFEEEPGGKAYNYLT